MIYKLIGLHHNWPIFIFSEAAYSIEFGPLCTRERIFSQLLNRK